MRFIGTILINTLAVLAAAWILPQGILIEEKSKAYQKLVTSNPSTNLSVNRIIPALITSKNKPNVTMVNGMVRTIKIGRRSAFSNAMTNAATRAVQLSSIRIP